MTGFAVGEKLILTGQILMALCCGIYIPWWFKVFKPEQPHNWIADGAGILLLLIVISGLSGLVFTAAGNSRVQSDGFFHSGNSSSDGWHNIVFRNDDPDSIRLPPPGDYGTFSHNWMACTGGCDGECTVRNGMLHQGNDSRSTGR